MPLTYLCLVLTLTFAAESLAATTLEDDIFAKFDSDYEVTSEKDEFEGFEYTLRNFTFPAFDGGGGHDRVKRLQQPIGWNNPAPLCIMTFNIRRYTSDPNRVRDKDVIIARVSFLAH